MLYNKYLELMAQGPSVFNDHLQNVYEIGKKVSYKVPGEDEQE